MNLAGRTKMFRLRQCSTLLLHTEPDPPPDVLGPQAPQEEGAVSPDVYDQLSLLHGMRITQQPVLCTPRAAIFCYLTSLWCGFPKTGSTHACNGGCTLLSPQV